MLKKYFTSESVTEGHPDKLCDQVSDAVLDEILKKDSNARVACEAVCTTGMVMLFGEISTSCYVDMSKIVRGVIEKVGYNNSNYGFCSKNCAVISNIDEQSSDIAAGVCCNSFELGAGDQGLVFGFACNETEELMPMPIVYAHKLSKRLAKVRKDNILPFLRPDGKTQVTVTYYDNIPREISTIVVSAQHDEDVSLDEIKDGILKHVIKPTIPKNLVLKPPKVLINPTGRFVIGGPHADSGLTGRKLMVDSYGGYSRHGGGAFSGKDPTKVDRSGAYIARFVAKNVVAAGLCEKCEIQIAYAIGVCEPVSITVESFGTGKYSDDVLCKIIRTVFDFKPKSIIDFLGLKNPIYSQFATYGHFGRVDLAAKWEDLSFVEILKKEAKNFKEVVYMV